MVAAHDIQHAHPALTVNDLSAGYPGDRRTIEDINFSVERGERIAIVGPNGAGKSTLFKAIAGLIPFTSGDISVMGADCTSSHAHVGYVPQHNEIDWSFPVTVYDVVMMGRAGHSRWLPFWNAADRDRVCGLLEQLGVVHLAKRQIGELSGGQQRRVFIARALAQEANVLLMDEPFTGVDTTSEQDIMGTLEALNAQGITILLATHNMGRAARDFDRVMLLKRRMLAYGNANEVMQPDVLREAYGGALTVMHQGDATVFIADEHGVGD